MHPQAMTFRRTIKLAIATRPLSCLFFAVVVVVGAGAFGVASASASLTGDVVKTVGTVVPAVAPPAPPPSTPPPPAPPAPTVIPAAPKVSTPSPPPSPVTTVKSTATKVVGQVANVVSGGGSTEPSKQVAEALTNASGAVANAPSAVTNTPSAAATSKEVTKQVAPSVTSSESAGPARDHVGSVPTAELGEAGGDPALPDAASRKHVVPGAGAPPSIRSARVAPFPRWLARIWPAIALGRDGAARVRGQDALSLSVSDVARLLLAGALGVSASGGDLTAAAPATTPDAPSSVGPRASLVPGGREITFFVIFSFAALLAFLISAVWVEVRSKYLYH
jgi:hypothetical protein